MVNAAAWSFAAAAAAVTGAVTSSDSFCGTCHVMAPHVDSHRRSAHARVSCAACHIPDEPVSAAALKARAAVRTAGYLVGAPPSAKAAEVPDGRCLAPGCHSAAALDSPGRLAGKGIEFVHRKHTSRPGGAAVDCLACHNASQEGSHMSLDMAACFLCHMRPGLDRRLSRCVLCHKKPPSEVKLRFLDPEVRFRHSRVGGKPDSCAGCHGSVTRGGSQMCVTAFPFGVAAGATPEAAHAAVPRWTAVPCLSCHKPVIHGDLPPGAAIEADVSFDPVTEGGFFRSAAVRMYAGRTGRASDRPDIMFRRGVLCSACHPDSGKDPAPVPPARCGLCHEKALGRIPAEQKRTFTAWVLNLEDGWKRYGGFLSWDSGKRSGFEASLALVRGGAWVHNVPLAREVLASCEAVLESGTGGAFTPVMLPETDTAVADRSCTWRCHMAVPSMEHAGKPPLRIAHRRHITAAGLRCSRCHVTEAFDDSPSTHGRLVPGKPDCLRCHHLESAVKSACARCHRAQEAILGGEGVPGAGVVRRRSCPDAGCSDCHDPGDGTGGREEVLARCAACHKADRRTTLDSWQSAVRAKLEQVEGRIASLEGAASAAGAPGLAREKLLLARRQAAAVRADGSAGAHNVRYAAAVLDEAQRNADESAALLGR